MLFLIIETFKAGDPDPVDGKLAGRGGVRGHSRNDIGRSDSGARAPFVMPIVGLDHVQLAMPPGGEDLARRFYVGVLGLEEIPKPEPLAGRGGAWFRRGSVELHLGVEADFRPARKAHPALRVDGLPALIAHCVDAGYPVEREVRWRAGNGCMWPIRAGIGSSS